MLAKASTCGYCGSLHLHKFIVYREVKVTRNKVWENDPGANPAFYGCCNCTTPTMTTYDCIVEHE